MKMDKDLFTDLVTSLEEAKDIRSGKKQASRRFVVNAIDVKAVREKTGLSQSEFARMIQISTRTLQNWEQKRRNPTGPAVALLRLVAAEPNMALRSLADTH